MNIAKYSLDNPKVIYFFLFVMLIGGVISFGSLGKKEDSPFVIKTAVLITQYPGASPKEVEQLITEPIEREIQSMRRVYKIKSDSYYGMSKINIELSPATSSRFRYWKREVKFPSTATATGTNRRKIFLSGINTLSISILCMVDGYYGAWTKWM